MGNTSTKVLSLLPDAHDSALNNGLCCFPYDIPEIQHKLQTPQKLPQKLQTPQTPQKPQKPQKPIDFQCTNPREIKDSVLTFYCKNHLCKGKWCNNCTDCNSCVKCKCTEISCNEPRLWSFEYCQYHDCPSCHIQIKLEDEKACEMCVKMPKCCIIGCHSRTLYETQDFCINHKCSYDKCGKKVCNYDTKYCDYHKCKITICINLVTSIGGYCRDHKNGIDFTSDSY